MIAFQAQLCTYAACANVPGVPGRRIDEVIASMIIPQEAGTAWITLMLRIFVFFVL